MLRILVYDKLDDKKHPIPGERRALAAFTDEAAQQSYIADAGLEADRIKFDYFDAPRSGLPTTAQPDHICFARYKKWSRNGPFELSGYAYTQSFQDDAAGYDEFVMPILIDKSHEETVAWKEAAIQARLGMGRAYRQAVKALERLPAQEREKKEAEFLVDFAQQTYQAFKPKTRREVTALRLGLVLAVASVLVWLFLVPEQPQIIENAPSVKWLPEGRNVSAYRTPEVVVFEADMPLDAAQALFPGEWHLEMNTHIMRYQIFSPEWNNTDQLEMDDSEFEAWQNRFKASVPRGMVARLSDGSELLFDLDAERLYGNIRGESRDKL